MPLPAAIPALLCTEATAGGLSPVYATAAPNHTSRWFSASCEWSQLTLCSAKACRYESCQLPVAASLSIAQLQFSQDAALALSLAVSIFHASTKSGRAPGGHSCHACNCLGPHPLAGSSNGRGPEDTSAARGVSGLLRSVLTECLAATTDMRATCWDPSLSRQL